MFSYFTNYTLNMGFEGKIFIQVNAQIFHRFGWRYGSICHFHTFISISQEVFSLPNMKAQFRFYHPRLYLLNFILKCRISTFSVEYTQLVSSEYKKSTKSLTYLRNNSGPRIDLCRTSHSSTSVFEN